MNTEKFIFLMLELYKQLEAMPSEQREAVKKFIVMEEKTVERLTKR